MNSNSCSATIRIATPDDLDAIVALLPRLADFNLPASRSAAELWSGDHDIVVAWAQGRRPEVTVFVSTDSTDHVSGVAVVSLRPEMLSDKPSSHLEVLAVAKAAEGSGLGMRLLRSAEQHALANHAESMTLHVFAVNERARKLYEKAGFDGELIRYSKPLG